MRKFLTRAFSRRVAVENLELKERVELLEKTLEFTLTVLQWPHRDYETVMEVKRKISEALYMEGKGQ